MLDICRECGIESPSVVQVIGVDNEEYICEQTEPTLSSIEPDFESGGYEAMRALDAMLSGKRPPTKPIMYGIRGIVERQSTQSLKRFQRFHHRRGTRRRSPGNLPGRLGGRCPEIRAKAGFAADIPFW